MAGDWENDVSGKNTRLDTEAIAIELLDALDRGRTIPSVVERYPGFDWDDGYKVAADFSFHWRLIVG